MKQLKKDNDHQHHHHAHIGKRIIQYKKRTFLHFDKKRTSLVVTSLLRIRSFILHMYIKDNKRYDKNLITKCAPYPAYLSMKNHLHQTALDMMFNIT